MTTTGMESDIVSDEPETYDATEPEETKWGALRMIGLLALLAAFAGFVYLAYMQGVRNGAVGAPPVITADSGAYKIAPQNPGGETFGNQDKMIFDRVEGSGPEATINSVAPKGETRALSDIASADASGDDLVAHRSAPLVVAEDTTTQVMIPAPVAAAAAPEAEAATTANVSEPRADGIAAAIAKADHKGVGGPIDEADEILPQETGTPAATASQVATAAPTPAGAYVVQIASYRDKPAAEDAWVKFSANFSDVASSLTPNYQTADIPGKGTYFRLRVGPFESKDEANALCETLKARNQGCLVVKG